MTARKPPHDGCQLAHRRLLTSLCKGYTNVATPYRTRLGLTSVDALCQDRTSSAGFGLYVADWVALSAHAGTGGRSGLSDDVSDRSALGRDARVRTAIGTWRDSLINLTGRNRLINFKPSRTGTVEIPRPSPMMSCRVSG